MNALKVVGEKLNSYMAIHNRAVTAAANYKRCEVEMLEAIAEVESRQVYFQMEIKDLFQYCTEMLGLSRHAAYNFINVMHKAKEVPALLEAIRDGSTTVSKARKICSVITVKNAKDWIGLTRECSSRIVERAVAMANPRSTVFESVKYISGDTLEIKFAVSEEWSELLTDIKDLMSQKSKRAVTTEEALFSLMAEYKRKHDPVLKAKRAENRVLKSLVGPNSTVVNQNVALIKCPDDEQTANDQSFRVSAEDSNFPSSRYIPARTRHKVAIRDDGKCSFIDRHGNRCGSKRWIQRHHVHHFSHGGSHSAENLETLCWPHHVMKHRH